MSKDNGIGDRAVNDQVVKRIRERFDLTQTELAKALDVTFATVNRWENGKTSPPPAMREKLGEFCKERGARLEDFTGNKVESGRGVLMLYCLYQKTNTGRLSAEAVGNCPLGLSLVADENSILPRSDREILCYAATLDTEDLRIFSFGNPMDYILYEGFAEKKLSKEKYSALYQKYKDMPRGCDLIVGFEESPLLAELVSRFFVEQLTDVALIKAVERLSPSKRYIAVSGEAKSSVTLKEALGCEEKGQPKRGRPRRLPEWDAAGYGEDKKTKEDQEILDLEEILKTNRRVGLYLDELEEKERAKVKN